MSGAGSYTYDANGNMRTRPGPGGTNYLKFDAENRLVSISLQANDSSPFATFVYDGDGKRVKGTVTAGGTTTTSTYVGNSYEVQEKDSVITTRKYYFAWAQRIAVRENTPAGETLSFFLPDHLGSTAITVSAAGSTTAELRYSAWGETRYQTGTTPTNARYTGQMAEPALGSDPALGGLYYYGARWYDPALGRFISPDSIIPGAGDPQAWDRYAYVNNNPVNGTDPTGHWPWPVPPVPIPFTKFIPWASGCASKFGDLIALGIGHAPNAVIVGDGLQSLKDDPSVKDAQGEIINKIKGNPEYGNEPFVIKDDYGTNSFTANGPDRNWLTAAKDGNPAFWMVHTANLSATNTNVSADGTISTTWKVEDKFDYEPDWLGRIDELKTNPRSYFEYNGFAQLIAPIYHGLFQAQRYPTNAYWDETIPPE